MKVLVIGGTGFMGPDVVRLLTEADHDVTIFHRGEHEIEVARVRHLHGGREQFPEFRDEFARFAPDVVLDMRPMTERDATLTMQTFRRIATRVVAISSADVYRAYGRIWRTEPGPPDPVPLTEDAPLRERLYPHGGDYDKLLVERGVTSDPDLLGTVLRLGMVHGPRSHRYVEYVKRMLDGRPAILLRDSFARFRGTRAYSEDVAAAIALATEDDRAAGRIYNVGEAHGTSNAEWITLLGQAAGWRGEVVTVRREDIPAHLTEGLPREVTEDEDNLEQDLVIDTSRIRRELGYRERVTRAEGLRRTIAWLRANPSPPLPRGPLPPPKFDYAAEDELLASLRKAQ